MQAEVGNLRRYGIHFRYAGYGQNATNQHLLRLMKFHFNYSALGVFQVIKAHLTNAVSFSSVYGVQNFVDQQAIGIPLNFKINNVMIHGCVG